eukprot:1019346-Heterocapsa_arctica.AAC.1
MLVGDCSRACDVVLIEMNAGSPSPRARGAVYMTRCWLFCFVFLNARTENRAIYTGALGPKFGIRPRTGATENSQHLCKYPGCIYMRAKNP